MPSKASAMPEKRPARGISANLLDDLDHDDEADHNAVAAVLTAQEVNEMYDGYMQKMRELNRSVPVAQLSLITPLFIAPDEVRLIAKTYMAESWSQTVRNDMLDFFRARTRVVVRMTSEVQEDEAMRDSQPAILSKTDVYELLVKKNPLLQQLKDGLNLQIEY
jgi:hypothetical protein